MTLLEAAPATSSTAGDSPSRQHPAALGGPRPASPNRQRLGRQVGGTLLLAAFVVLGFVLYLFALSGLSEQRTQNTNYKTFAHTLSQAVAPVGPAAPGAPVAILDIPSIGMSKLVVVEGTDARRLENGPGHRRDTPLPGQPGVSVVYGRRATFGAPFGSLPKLHRNAVIFVTTGQGVSRYVVRSFGADGHPPVATSDNRLVLTTADSAFMPASTISVSADLISKPRPAPGGLPAIGQDERSMQGSPGLSVLPLMLWGQALMLVAVLGTIAVRRWAKWPAYACFAPIVLAVLWNIYENAATFLPNVF